MKAAFSENIYPRAPANTVYTTSDLKTVQFFGIFYQDKRTHMYKLLMCECVCDLLFRSKFQEIQNILNDMEKVKCTKNGSCFFTGCKNCHKTIDKRFECPFPCHEYKIKGKKQNSATSIKIKRQDSMDVENHDRADQPARMEEVKTKSDQGD